MLPAFDIILLPFYYCQLDEGLFSTIVTKSAFIGILTVIYLVCDLALKFS